MATNFISILSSVVLITNISTVNAAPVALSDDQLDNVTAGGTVWVAASASAYGRYPSSAVYVRSVAVNNGAVGGVSVAWASGSIGSNASTSGGATGIFVATNNTTSGAFGTVTYSVTTASAY